MKINEINAPVLPDTYEASMFLSQAIRAGKYAIQIHNVLKNEQEVESWVQKKIDLATAYINSVANYLETQPAESAVQEDADTMNWSTDKVKEFGDDLIKVSKGQMPSDLLNIDDLEDGWADADQASRDQKAETIGGQLISVLIGYLQFNDGQKPSAEDVKDAQEVVNDPEFKKAYHSNESIAEDAGEGHMAKSQLYSAAKSAIKITQMVQPGDDIEAWVQTKMNRAVDMLDAVYHYEDYQRLNPYREQLDSNILQRHSQIVQKNIDEILARETPANDTETKPGMLNILKKRVHEVEKKMCREYSKEKPQRQLVDPDKEVMVQKDGKVITIDKSREKEYLDKGWELAENISQKDIDKFHTNLDKLVHKSFGASSDEKKSKKENTISEDPRAVGKALANIKYGKEIADAILKGTDIGILKAKATAYLSSIDDTLELLNQMYPSQYNKNESVVAERMPAQIIKNKQKLAYMSDRELANHLKDKDETTLRQMAWRHGYGKMSSHYWDRVQRGLADTHDDDVLDTEFDDQPRYRGQRLDIGDSIEEGLGDWAKKLAAAGIIVGTLAGIGTLNQAMNDSVPVIQAMKNAKEMALQRGDVDLAQQITQDLKGAVVRIESGKDLNQIKYLQDKYSKFMPTEGIAYESKLAILLNQRLK